MKYGKLTMGQIEAIVNKLGGMDGVQRLLSGETILTTTVKSNFKFDKTKSNWTIVEDVGFNPAIKSVKDLILTPFLKDGEESIRGEELISRARRKLKANYGQIHAEYLLEHQKEIPEEFREYDLLVFPGTIWREDWNGSRFVPCLCWRDSQWYLHWRWLGLNWDNDYRLLRPRK